MKSPFQAMRPIFAVLDRQSGWATILSLRMVRGASAPIDVRDMESLEALDSCLADNETPVGLILADDFAELSEIVSFVSRHSGRPNTAIVIARRLAQDEQGDDEQGDDEQADQELEWLLREAGAHHVIRSTEDALSLTGPLGRFFAAY